MPMLPFDPSSVMFDPPGPDQEWHAYFIAGQAVIALLEGVCGVTCASVVPEDDSSGWIDVQEPDLAPGPLAGSNQKRACAVIRARLAGPAAQEAYSFGRHPSPLDMVALLDEGATIWHAVSLAGRVIGDGTAVLPALWEEMQEMLLRDDVWAAVEAVAEALLREGELAGCEIMEIGNRAIADASRIKRP